MSSATEQRQDYQQPYNNYPDDLMNEMDLTSTESPMDYFFNRALPPSFHPESQLISGDMMSAYFGSGELNGTEDNYFLENNNNNGLVFDESYYQMTTVFPDHHLTENGTVGLESIWEIFDKKYLRHSLGWTVTLVVAYTLILVIGIVGNIMVILVVALRPQMRTVTNIFIMNLAVADLFVIVFCVPATLLANVFTPWILGSFMCKAVTYVQGISVCASAYSLAAISLDRCNAIYRPMERPRGLSKSQALFTICLIWAVALLMTTPWAVIFNVIVSEKDGLSYCLETWENEQHGKIYFLVANLIFCYCFPLVLISISNVSIWCHVSHRKVPQDSASANTIKKMHRQTRHGVRKMLSIVTLAFLLSWLPLYVLVTRVKFSKNISEDESNLLEFLMPLAQWLGSWNSSINPVLYAFLNSKFREMFKSLLPSWVPFVHRNDANVILRNNVGRGTITNGTLGGTTGTPSYSHLARNSTVRSSNNSRRSHYSKKGHSPSPRSLAVNNFPYGVPPASPTVRESKSVLVRETSAKSTVSVIIDRNEGTSVPRMGRVPSTKKSTTVTDL